MINNLDGYTSQKDWLNKHKGLIPSAFLFSCNYEDITELPIPNKDTEDNNYTPRPSFIKVVGLKISRMDIDSILNSMPFDEREKKLLKLIYEQNLTQAEVGLELGVSQGLVSMIHAKAIKKLKGRLLN